MKPKYVPLDKRSKQKQKEFHDSQRRGWGDLNPITRKTANQKAYNRKKSERWHEYEPSVGFFCCVGGCYNSSVSSILRLRNILRFPLRTRSSSMKAFTSSTLFSRIV